MKNHIAPILMTSCILLFFLITGFYGTTQYDDSFITYRFSNNLYNYFSFNYNFNDFTDSASSYIYTIALSIIKFFKIEPHITGPFIGFSSFYIIIFLLNKEVQKFGLSLIEGFAFYFLVTFNFINIIWISSGMETFLWSLINLYLFICWRNRDTNLFFYIGVAIIPFIRFEGILLPIFLFIDQLYFRKFILNKTNIFLLSIIFTFSCIYLLKFIFHDITISHAYMMKEVHTYYSSKPLTLIKGITIFTPFIFFLLFSFKYEIKNNLISFIYLFFCSALVLFGPHGDYYRYSLHLIYMSLPLVFYGYITSKKILKFTPIAYLGILFCLVIFSTFSGIKNSFPILSEAKYDHSCRKEVALYINDNIPSNEWIVSGDIGVISYYADKHRFIDTVGLTSPSVLVLNLQKKSIIPLLKEKQAKYIADTFSTKPGSDNILAASLFFGTNLNSNDYELDFNPIMKCQKYNTRYFGIKKINLIQE